MAPNEPQNDQRTVPLDHQLEDGYEHPQTSEGAAHSPRAANSDKSIRSASSSLPPHTVINPVTTQGPVAVDQSESTQQTVASTSKPKKKLSRKLKLLLIGILAMLLLAGSGAAAYFGYIVPNKPENVLKTAIADALQMKQGTFSGSLTVKYIDQTEAASEIGSNFTIDFSGSGDTEKATAQFDAEIAIAGVKTPVELRMIDKSLYVRLKNLSAIESLANSFIPDAKPLVTKISAKVTNQWIEFDDSLFDAETSKCTFSPNITVTEQDLETIFTIYNETPFAVINKTATEQVAGADAYKYDLTIKGKESEKALNEMANRVGVLKQLKSCLETADDTLQQEESFDVPISLWVNKANKKIVKVAITMSDKEKQEYGYDGEIVINIKDGATAVEKPSNAKSATVLAAELQAILAEDPTLLMLFGDGVGEVENIEDSLQLDDSGVLFQ